MLSLPVCPLRHTFRVSEPLLPYLQHASCFQPRAVPRPHLARAIKNPTARLAVGDKVKNSAVPPRLTRHRCRTLSSTANTVRLLTRALRPRLLVTFRLGPPGPILSGSVPAGITPSPTLSQSVSRFLPVNGLLSCFYSITAFFPRQRILTRFFEFSARSSPNARRARTRAHTVSLLFRTARQIFPRALHSNAERSRTSSFSAHVSTRCPQALSASATHLTKTKSNRRRKHMRKTTGGSA